MGIPDHLICLLRHLCAGQEATVKTGHGTTDWFQIGKGGEQRSHTGGLPYRPQGAGAHQAGPRGQVRVSLHVLGV